MAILDGLKSLLGAGGGTTIIAMSPTGQLDVVNLDATIRRSHNDSAQISDFAVEQGIDGTDNAKIDPQQIVVEGVITDSPIALLGIGGGPNRAVQTYQQIRRIFEQREPVFVAAEIRGSSDMIIAGIDVDEDPDTGDCIPIVLTLRKATILTTLLIPVDFDFDALVAGAGGTADLGTQSTMNPLDYTGPTQVAPVSPF